MDKASISDEMTITVDNEPVIQVQDDGVKANPHKGKWHMRLIVRDSQGKIKTQLHSYNLVTANGKAGIADQILGSPTLNKPGYIAVGTGTPGSNALGTEISRAALTSKTRSGATVTMVANWTAGQIVGTLTEAGVFDASSTGNMWMSNTFSTVVGSTQTVQITWQLTIN